MYGLASGTCGEHAAALQVAFSALPDVPMVPRPSDPRVGYFTNSILVGGPRQATTVQHVISKWNLERHQYLQYVIDRAVPKL